MGPLGHKEHRASFEVRSRALAGHVVLNLMEFPESAFESRICSEWSPDHMCCMHMYSCKGLTAVSMYRMFIVFTRNRCFV